MKFTYLIFSLVLLVSTFGCESKSTTKEPTQTTCTDDLNYSESGVTFLDWEDWGENHPLKNVVRWSKEPFDLIKDARAQRVFFQIKENDCWVNVRDTPYPDFDTGWRRTVEKLESN